MSTPRTGPKASTTRLGQRAAALSAASALLAGGFTALVALPAHADGPERHARGSIAGGQYEISIEKERRFQVDVELDRVPANSTWRIVVRHEGRRGATRTARAAGDDGRWDVDFPEVRSGNTPGADTFRVRIQRVGGTAQVTRTLRFAR